ncbi:PX domain-containing protein kinase-like protein isoform X2 [Condylostylus longicornis]|nr:PX domain-containing protein kinase-like protein isoform X2 [Condylostylus longicornis]
MHPDFIAERRKALQEFLNEVLMNPILASSLPTKRFVDPDSYSQSFHDNAVQGASLCLRTDGLYTLGQSMGQIGWRLRKHYFKVSPKPPQEKSSLGKHLVKSSSQSNQSKNQHQQNTSSHQSSTSGSCNSSSNVTGTGNSSNNGISGTSHSGSSSNQQTELVLTWTEYGPDKYMEEKEIHSVLKSLSSLQHSYIEPILFSGCNDSGALVIRKFHGQGTLKDLICLSTPKKAYLSKYGSCKNRVVLSLRQIALYGFQILDALRFLHSKGIPFGHLHTGNIIITDDGVRLLDIENFVLGVPAFYRPFFVQHSKMHTMENIDVYCFGHVLFEMCMGYPMQESIMRQPLDIPEPLKQLLESLLSKEACKNMLPTLEQLAEHKFFKEYSSPDETLVNTKGHLKLSTNAKEQLKIAIQKTEQRLQNEQKSVKNQKRLVRVQELMSSEEEKKKSKHKMKVEQKQSKLKQQTSLQTQNGPSLSLASTSSSFASPTNEPEITTPKSSTLNKSESIFSQSTSQETPLSPPSSQASSQLSPPPPPPALPIDIPTIAKSAESIVENNKERSALLESICRFNRSSLRKVKSNDE